MAAAARAEDAPDSIAEYIEEMLSELAAMAEGIGERRLATSMRLLAIEAARVGGEGED